MTFSSTPCNFSHLIGNAHAKEILSRLICQKCVPQVLLFEGPRGVGKGLFALELARALLQSPKQAHPDLHILYPDPDSDQHPIATIRSLIDEIGLPPFEAPCKMFIIHDIEKMLPASSNALLKTLEEPPSDTQLILLTSQPSALLPTTLSRCSKIPFYPVSEEELVLFLSAKTPDAQKIALLAEGSVAEALARLDHPTPSLPLNDLFQCQNYPDLHHLLTKHLEKLGELSSVETDRLFEEMLYWIRQHAPLQLEKAIPLVIEARTALFHHLKLKTVLEKFFLNYLF